MSKFKAVVFDWAGTMIDFGSFAPMGVFVKAFETFGITATIDQARGPMGKPKWDHIRSMMDDPDICAQWIAKYGQAPTDADVDKVYIVLFLLLAYMNWRAGAVGAILYFAWLSNKQQG